MTGFLRRLFDLREGEGLKASLMFCYGMLIIATVVILKSVSNSLFVDSQGAGKLPYVFMLVALFSVAVASLYSRYSKKVRLSRLVTWTIVFSVACLSLFRLLLGLPEQQGWIFYAFYTWVVIFSVITGSQFWLLANDIYDAREAKRIFGFVGAGAIIGGIAGGMLTNGLVPLLGTRNLIFVGEGFLIVCLLLVMLIRGMNAQEAPQRRRRSGVGGAGRARPLKNPARIILDSRHLTFLAGIICVEVLAAGLADYQYRILAERAFVESDALTAFFGLMQSLVNIFALAIQLLLTGRVMKRLGVTASLFFLPLGLLAGAVGILISPALWSAMVIKLSDGGFKHSMNRAGIELLYLPIRPEFKKRAKTFIDVFLKNFSNGVAGLALIGLTMGLGLNVRHVSLVLTALILLWGYLIIRIKREYVDSFRQAIEKRSIDLDEQTLNVEDASLRSGFLAALEDRNERQVLYILGLLENVKSRDLSPHLERLIEHPSPEVRAAVLRMALAYPDIDLSAAARDLIGAEDIGLQREAISYLVQTSPDRTASLREFLTHSDPRIQAGGVLHAAREWRENREVRKEIALKEVLSALLQRSQAPDQDESLGRFLKIQAAIALGQAGDRELHGLLQTLLRDDDPEVVKAAVDSIGRTPDKECLPYLLDNLNTRHIRIAIRECLAAYGEDVIDALAELLDDQGQERRKRLAAPPVLALIDSQRSVDILWRQLQKKDPAFRYQGIRALNRLRAGFPHLRFEPQLIKARIFDEVDLYRLMLQSWMRQNLTIRQERSGPEDKDGGPSRSRMLLALAMEEKLQGCLERIFRLLGLRYPPRDMVSAYLGLMSDASRLRANAIEFLDNVLDSDLKKSLIPMVEYARPQALKKERTLAGSCPLDEDASLELILKGGDKWLTACAVYLIAMHDYRQFKESLGPLAQDDHPLVREIARLCLQRFDHA